MLGEDPHMHVAGTVEAVLQTRTYHVFRPSYALGVFHCVTNGRASRNSIVTLRAANALQASEANALRPEDSMRGSIVAD